MVAFGKLKSTRKVMGGLVKEQRLDEESLQTLLCEAESIINGRPLTTVSGDPRDLNPLTPNHLLLLSHDTSLPPGLFVKSDMYSRRRWRQVQYFADVFLEALEERVFTSATRTTKMASSEEKFCRERYRNRG